MLDLFLPVIRADFLLNESYVYRAEPPLACAISSFGGLDDEWADHDDLLAWAQHTSRTFSARLFPGDHFFIHSSQSPVIRAICADLLPAPLVPTTTNREAADAG
jgi:medium-chain acyl-[acyl-carrier-protein] hydrolase